MKKSFLAVSLALVSLSAQHAQADDAIFTHVYLAETMHKGEVEVEQWYTKRSKRSQGLYELTQLRSELAYGLNDKWTVAVYANTYAVSARNNNSTASRNNYTAIGDGDEVSGGGPVTSGPYVSFAELLPLPAAHYKNSGFESFSVESLYQFMHPRKDGVGVAGYLEATYGSKVKGLELKLITQKNFLENSLIAAGNVALEFENEKWSEIILEKETKLSFSAGLSYRLATNWRVGMEMLNERLWEGGHSLSKSKRDSSAWYFGPNLHYANKAYSVTAGYMKQMQWATAYSPAARDELVAGRVYKASELHRFRVIAGISF